MNYLSYKKYLIFLKVEKPFSMDSYSFAIFHGIMGRLLYNLDTKAARLNHKGCSDECAYCSLFKYQLPPTHEAYGLYTNPPQGFVLKPPYPSPEKYPKGDFIELELTLVGGQEKYLDSIDLAFSQISILNLKSFNGCFSYLGMKLIKEFSSIRNASNDNINSLGYSLSGKKGERSFLLKTPLRLISKGKYIPRPTFSQLINSLIKRVNLLELIYCERPFEHKLLSEEVGVTIEAQEELYNRSGSRVEMENGKELNISGIVGSYTLSGSEVNDYILLLEYAADIHVGQYASYGMGQLLCIDTQEVTI